MGIIPYTKEGGGVEEGQNGIMEESFRRMRSNLRFLTERVTKMYPDDLHH